jgi:hypothetical protein
MWNEIIPYDLFQIPWIGWRIMKFSWVAGLLIKLRKPSKIQSFLNWILKGLQKLKCLHMKFIVKQNQSLAFCKIYYVLPLYFRCNVALSLLLPQITTTMYPVLDCHLDNGRFHLHLLVYPVVYQFNSRTVALVYSSFANDYSSKRFQHYFNIISKFVCRVFYMKLECSFYT